MIYQIYNTAATQPEALPAPLPAYFLILTLHAGSITAVCSVLVKHGHFQYKKRLMVMNYLVDDCIILSHPFIESHNKNPILKNIYQGQLIESH